MVKIVLHRTLSGLQAVDDADKELLAKVNVGTWVTCEIKQARNIQFHRKFFALAKLVYENLPENIHYANQDQFLVALKVALGHCDTVICKDGSTAYIPSSISFASMDDLAFSDFYDKAVRIVVKYFLPGVTSQELENEVLDLIS